MRRAMTRRLLREEAGTSVVEMVMVIALLGVVMGFVMRGFLSMSSTVANTDSRLQNLEEVRYAMDIVSRDLRTATSLSAGTAAFTLADPLKVTFYGNLLTTGSPNKVELYIDSTIPSTPKLIERTTTPDVGSSPPTYLTATPKIRVIARYIVNTTSTPMFVFRDSAGAILGTVGVALNSSQMLLVQSVDISIAVRKTSAPSVPTTTLANRVRLPNVIYGALMTPSP
jgi:Tfp pilus assembly protein PilW